MRILFHPVPKEVETVVLAASIQPRRNGNPTYSLTFFPSVIKTLMVLYAPLTVREVEVLFWAAMGLTNREIAEILVIKESTVETFFQKIFTKMGVDDRTEAVVWAISSGLIMLYVHDCLDM